MKSATRTSGPIGGNRLLTQGHVCRQEEYAAETIVEVSRIEDNVPAIVWPLIALLFERFSFFRLPSNLVAEWLTTMKSHLY
jgi:hypothetical protein